MSSSRPSTPSTPQRCHPSIHKVCHLKGRASSQGYSFSPAFVMCSIRHSNTHKLTVTVNTINTVIPFIHKVCHLESRASSQGILLLNCVCSIRYSKLMSSSRPSTPSTPQRCHPSIHKVCHLKGRASSQGHCFSSTFVMCSIRHSNTHEPIHCLKAHFLKECRECRSVGVSECRSVGVSELH